MEFEQTDFMGIFEAGIKSLADVLGKSLELSEKADEICAACAGCIARGGTVFSCGNGGGRPTPCTSPRNSPANTGFRERR